MKIIFQQHMQFVRHTVNARNEDRELNYYGTYTAYYDAKQSVLVCEQTVACYTSGVLMPEVPPRKLVDVRRRTSSDYHAQAVRDAVAACDWYAEKMQDWCAENSEYPVAESAAEAQP